MTRSTKSSIPTPRWVLVDKTGKTRASIVTATEKDARAAFVAQRGGTPIPEGWTVKVRPARGKSAPLPTAPAPTSEPKAEAEPKAKSEKAQKRAEQEAEQKRIQAETERGFQALRDHGLQAAALGADFHARVNDFLVSTLVETAQRVRENATQQRASYRDLGYNEDQLPSAVAVQQAAFARLMDMAQGLTPSKNIPVF